MKISHLQCSLCKTIFSPNEVIYTCPHDGGNLDVIPDYENIQQTVDFKEILSSPRQSIWRYLPLLPLSDPGFEATPLHRVGWTPIYAPKQLTHQLNVPSLWIKDESPNPSASFKDRASAVVLAKASQEGVRTVVVASTGNAGAATAAMGAAIGLDTVILAPKNAPPAKIAQLLVFGARVYLVDGNYDQAFELSIAASKEFGWYNRNTGYNPYTTEGKKTAAFEIWEQVLLNLAPEQTLNIVIPVGDGNIITGIHKGFKDLLMLGWIEHMPRLIGVQANGSAAIADAWQTNSHEIVPVQANTIADSISVNLPRDGWRALRAVWESNGCFVKVSDGEILTAITSLGKAGIFAEPAAAAAYAGLVKGINDGSISRENPVMVINTGSGLKDIKACMQAVAQAQIVEPNIQSLRKFI